VQEISFLRGPSFVRIVRERDGYWIVEPYRDRAAAELIDQSLRVASTLEPLRILPDTMGAPFGLAPPFAVWRCVWSGGEYVIALGDSIPAGGGRYARRTGSREVVVVDPFLARRFLAPPIQDLHSMVACPLGVGPIDSVRIVTRDEKIVVVRRRADFWEIVAPIHAEASAAELARAVQNLRTATMTQILGPTERFDLAALGLAPPRATWTLVQGANRMTAHIGHPTPDERSAHLIPAGREVVGWIGTESFRTWVDGLAGLRESRMLWASADSVGEVVVRRGSERRDFVKSTDRGWRELAAAETLEVRQDAFTQALQNICAVRAIAYSAPAEDPSSAQVIRIRLVGPGGRADSVELSPPGGASGAARGTRQPTACAVSSSAYRAWSLWLGRPLRP
jgi:hypothetical protein